MKAEPLWTDERLLAKHRELRKSYRTNATTCAVLTGVVIADYEAKLDEYQSVYLYYIAQAEKSEAKEATLTEQLAVAKNELLAYQHNTNVRGDWYWLR